MDPISVAASILAVLGALTSTAKLARTVWKAPQELQQLASELDELDTLAKTLAVLTRERTFEDVDVRGLDLTYAKLRDAQRVFEEWLSKKSNRPELRFKRKTWTLHRGRMKRLIGELAALRTHLTSMLLVLNLSSANALRDQQSEIWGLVHTDPLHHTTLLRDLADSNSTSRDAAPESNLVLLREDAGEDLEDLLDAASQYSEGIAEALSFYTPCSSLSDYAFERSETFFPEQYVLPGPLTERLAVFTMIELERTPAVRIDRYLLLFAKDARHWRRVAVTATTTEGSRLSEMRSLNNKDFHYHVLPGQMRPQLEAMLDTIQLFISATNIALQLHWDDDGNITFDPEHSRVTEDLELALTADTSSYVKEVDHRGCPQYLESEVIVLSYATAKRSIVLVESQQCIERKLPFTGDGADDFLTEMKLLQAAQGCFGVAKFMGVVLTDDRQQIRSYLTPYPEIGGLFEIIGRARAESAVLPWERRARWIRQLITIVSGVHKRGLPVGCLNFANLWVNSADDSVVLLSLKSKGDHICNVSGQLPPELRGHTAPGHFAIGQNMTFQTDLFQLGLCIWLLVHHLGRVTGAFCHAAECTAFPRYKCRADHNNPIGLPLCGPEVPPWVDEVIGYCRQEQPNQRKPACELLALLPANAGDDHTGTTFFSPKISLQDHIWASVACDECQVVTTDAYYHCDACSYGNFDLCPQCYSRGIRCWSDGHDMGRIILKNRTFIREDASEAMHGV